MRKSKKLSSKLYLGIVLVALPLALVRCRFVAPAAEVTPGTPPPNLPADQQIRDAFLVSNPVARREAILVATEAFLRDSAVRQWDDATASGRLTEIAFQSGQPVFSDPAFVRRQGTLIVIGLPDGLGLYLHDLSAAPGSRPLQLSPWTVGLDSVDVTWAGNEFGVGYVTVDSNQTSHAHYVVSSKTEVGWQVMWFSDEQPEWWFNARNATITVAPYLSRLTVVGEATGSTSTFDESGDEAPRRMFRMEWLREKEAYKVSPAPSSEEDRQYWVWRVAQPSAYSTLVELIERARLRDTQGIAPLVSDPSLMETIFSFGLHLPDARYRVTAIGPESITFQGQQGAFVATFEAPVSEGAPWLLTGLQPLGAASSPTPQPQ